MNGNNAAIVAIPNKKKGDPKAAAMTTEEIQSSRFLTSGYSNHPQLAITEEPESDPHWHHGRIDIAATYRQKIFHRTLLAQATKASCDADIPCFGGICHVHSPLPVVTEGTKSAAFTGR